MVWWSVIASVRLRVVVETLVTSEDTGEWPAWPRFPRDSTLHWRKLIRHQLVHVPADNFIPRIDLFCPSSWPPKSESGRRRPAIPTSCPKRPLPFLVKYDLPKKTNVMASSRWFDCCCSYRGFYVAPSAYIQHNYSEVRFMSSIAIITMLTWH